MTYQDVEGLVSQGIPEGLRLEYKSGRPQNLDRFRSDIALDISAFANSDGGTIIIGVREENRRPSEIDGVDLSTLNRERLGQIAASRISPNIPGLDITEVRGPEGKDLLIVSVARSDIAPHQGPNNTYYRRHQYHNQPLAHFEIEDLRLRRIALPPLVTASTAARGVVLAAVDIQNIGQFPAEDLRFEFSSLRLWENDRPPDPLINGIRSLGPGQRLRFRAQPFPKLLAQGSPPAIFETKISYLHTQVGRKINETCVLDFEAYRGAMSVATDSEQALQTAVAEIERIRKALEGLTTEIHQSAGRLIGANGLDLSLYSLRNLRAIARGEPIERLSPRDWPAPAISAAVNVDIELASRIREVFGREFFSRQDLAEVEGMTDELMARLEASFELCGRDK